MMTNINRKVKFQRNFEGYKFILLEDGFIEVYKNGIHPIITFKPDNQIDEIKQFDIECSDWYFKNR